MCLDRVDKETKRDVKYAYKLFDSIGGKKYYPYIYEGRLWSALEGICFTLYWELYTRFRRTYNIGRVYTSTKQRIKAGDGTGYRSGFHCYVNKADAIAWRNNPFVFEPPIVKVAIEDIVASGYQDGDVVVARKMELVEESNPNS